MVAGPDVCCPCRHSGRETTTANPSGSVVSTRARGLRPRLDRRSEPDHQVDALRRAGVAEDDIYVDHTSGAKALRPQLDIVLRLLRAGDTLKITRLDRLGRSVLHLVTLGAELREKGVELHVIEQGIDTTTAEGRAMFGMLSSCRATARAHRRQHPRRARRRPRPRPQRRAAPEAQPGADRTRAAALRRRRAHRPADRGHLRGSPDDDLRSPRPDHQERGLRTVRLPPEDAQEPPERTCPS